MVGLIAFVSPDSLVISPKVYARKFIISYYIFGTATNPAALTKPIGLPADALAVMVFASPSGQFYHDVTNPAHLSGLSHLDNFIVTRKSCPSIGTLQKRMPTPTRTATNPHHRAVRCYSFENRQPLPFIEYIMTRKFHPFIGTQSSASFILT